MNKKGFTLIELLAVIVILAIISLIATPIVLNIISDAKESANERSLELYKEAVKEAVVRAQMKGIPLYTNYTSSEDGKILTPRGYDDDSKKLIIDYNGNVYCDLIHMYKDGSAWMSRCTVNGEAVSSNNEKLLFDANGTETRNGVTVSLSNNIFTISGEAIPHSSQGTTWTQVSGTLTEDTSDDSWAALIKINNKANLSTVELPAGKYNVSVNQITETGTIECINSSNTCAKSIVQVWRSDYNSTKKEYEICGPESQNRYAEEYNSLSDDDKIKYENSFSKYCESKNSLVKGQLGLGESATIELQEKTNVTLRLIIFEGVRYGGDNSIEFAIDFIPVKD